MKGSPSILAAGLEPVLVEALRRAWPAAKIEGVYSGRETLERVARVPYLALILDHRVADPPAVEVLRRVRSMGLDLPVVYCLAPEELRKRPRKGAQAVLLQPVTAPQVLQALAGMAELAAWVPVVQTVAAAPGSPVADRPAPATREAVPLHVGHSPASTPSPVATVLEAPIPTPLAAAPRAAASRALPTPKTNPAPDKAPNATPD
ncbi:MAG: response regulator, partial [Terriglobales bacterium]